MNQDTKPVVPGWYWVIAIVALLWNLTGCTFFAIELFVLEKMIESMTLEQQEWALADKPEENPHRVSYVGARLMKKPEKRRTI